MEQTSYLQRIYNFHNFKRRPRYMPTFTAIQVRLNHLLRLYSLTYSCQKKRQALVVQTRLEIHRTSRTNISLSFPMPLHSCYKRKVFLCYLINSKMLHIQFYECYLLAERILSQYIKLFYAFSNNYYFYFINI
jgi:hypothetical protein